MNVNAILIDDERKALAILKNSIQRVAPDINILAQTQSPEEGLELIKDLKPNLVFLDIAMPKISGFDLLKRIPEPSFEIIFVTAFDKYAIDAIQHCAIGYLVKPFDNDDLTLAINNALKNIRNKTALKKNTVLVENLSTDIFQKKKIVISTHQGMEFVEIKDIIYCEGVDGYTNFYFTNGKTLLSSNRIGVFYKMLENKAFYLIHRSYLINLDHMNRYLNEGYVEMNNNKKLPVSRNRRTGFLDLFRK